jgi:hypothetical protein
LLGTITQAVAGPIGERLGGGGEANRLLEVVALQQLLGPEGFQEFLGETEGGFEGLDINQLISFLTSQQGG